MATSGGGGRRTGGARAILVSPRPVDAYPPVQYQAAILAERGMSVHLLTAPLADAAAVRFRYRGVRVHVFAAASRSALVRRMALAAMSGRLSVLRLARRRKALEIAYDPVGVAVSSWARGRASFLIHHHHEIFFGDGASRFERPARMALPEADLVIVADAGRKPLMEEMTPAPRRVAVVRNTPRTDAIKIGPAEKTHDFSVVYFGVVSPNQCLDIVVRSMAGWPKNSTFQLYGTAGPGVMDHLRALADDAGAADRLAFAGWVPMDRLIATIARHHIGVSLLRPANDNLIFCAGASNKRFQLMAAGLPQITDDAPGLAALVAAPGAGTCVRFDDVDGIAAAVRAYAADPDRVTREGRAAQALIRGSLNYDTEFAPVLELAGLSGRGDG